MSLPYSFLFFFLVSYTLPAQPNIMGLGNYHLGLTTPDSLKTSVFVEQDQALVKGTIALTCSHIRIFKATQVSIAGNSITDCFLFFYDNLLFKISGNCSGKLNDTLTSTNGKGISSPIYNIVFCTMTKARPMLVWGTSWQNRDGSAVIVHAKGLNSACLMEETVKLSIVSRSRYALASDCDLNDSSPVTDEFEKLLNERQ